MLELYGISVASRLLLGTARYPSPAILSEAVRVSRTNIVTVSLRRETAGSRTGILRIDPHTRRKGLAQHRRLPHRL
jgi:thiazole synthase ThiGH ThiG subunit